jgi:hypothetical protein
LNAHTCALQGISQGVASVRLALGNQLLWLEFDHDARQREGLRFDKSNGAFWCFKGKFASAQAGQRVELEATALRPRGREAVTQAAAGGGRKPVGCPTGLINAKMNRARLASKWVPFEARRLSSSISSDLTSLRRIIFGMNRLFGVKDIKHPIP